MTTGLARVAALIHAASGFWIKPDQLGTLHAALSRVDPQLAADEGRLATLAPDSPVVRQLVEEVTVKETFFFRQDQLLRGLNWRQIADRAQQRGAGHARVWVAACATGEEAYTLAIMACGAFAPAPAPVQILGTDISRIALDHARHGIYGRRSLKAIDRRTRDRYFTQHGERSEIGDPVRGMVTFAEHNLVDGQPPAADAGGFDLITCRNVLIYFDGPTIERVVASLERALAPGGELHLGSADRLCVSSQRLRRLDTHAAATTGLTLTSNGHRTKSRRRDRRSEHASPRRQADAGARRVDTAETPERSGGEEPLREALAAANQGQLELAATLTARMLEGDPLDADAHFVRGLAELGLGDAAAATASFRAALYVDDRFGLAAFQLARAHDACGDTAAAARAYRRALNLLLSSTDAPDRNGRRSAAAEHGTSVNSVTGRHALLYADIDSADIASACSLRLQALSNSQTSDVDRG